MLSYKWDICITPPPMKTHGPLWQKEAEIIRAKGREDRAKIMSSGFDRNTTS